MELKSSWSRVVTNISLIGKKSCLNYIRVTQVLDKIFPDVKRILIEQKEEDLFKQIIQNKGKVKLLVNF
jgi:hypothetical protein